MHLSDLSHLYCTKSQCFTTPGHAFFTVRTYFTKACNLRNTTIYWFGVQRNRSWYSQTVLPNLRQELKEEPYPRQMDRMDTVPLAEQNVRLAPDSQWQRPTEQNRNPWSIGCTRTFSHTRELWSLKRALACIRAIDTDAKPASGCWTSHTTVRTNHDAPRINC